MVIDLFIQDFFTAIESVFAILLLECPLEEPDTFSSFIFLLGVSLSLEDIRCSTDAVFDHEIFPVRTHPDEEKKKCEDNSTSLDIFPSLPTHFPDFCPCICQNKPDTESVDASSEKEIRKSLKEVSTEESIVADIEDGFE